MAARAPPLPHHLHVLGEGGAEPRPQVGGELQAQLVDDQAGEERPERPQLPPLRLLAGDMWSGGQVVRVSGGQGL